MHDSNEIVIHYPQYFLIFLFKKLHYVQMLKLLLYLELLIKLLRK